MTVPMGEMSRHLLLHRARDMQHKSTCRQMLDMGKDASHLCSALHLMNSLPATARHPKPVSAGQGSPCHKEGELRTAP